MKLQRWQINRKLRSSFLYGSGVPPVVV